MEIIQYSISSIDFFGLHLLQSFNSYLKIKMFTFKLSQPILTNIFYFMSKIRILSHNFISIDMYLLQKKCQQLKTMMIYWFFTSCWSGIGQCSTKQFCSLWCWFGSNGWIQLWAWLELECPKRSLLFQGLSQGNLIITIWSWTPRRIPGLAFICQLFLSVCLCHAC